MAIARSLCGSVRCGGNKGLLDRLPPILTINGSSVAPTFRYLGRQASASGWLPGGYGETLTLQAGTAPTFQQPAAPNLRGRDKSVLFKGSGGGFYRGTSTTIGNVGTDDLVIEVIYKHSASTLRLFSKRSTSGAGLIGYDLYTAGNMQLFVGSTDITSITVTSATLTAGAWYHALIFVNRNEDSTNGGKIYINGIVSGTGNSPAAQSGSLDTTRALETAYASNASTYNSNIAYFAMWHAADWHKAGADGPSEWATIAANRANFLGF